MKRFNINLNGYWYFLVRTGIASCDAWGYFGVLTDLEYGWIRISVGWFIETPVDRYPLSRLKNSTFLSDHLSLFVGCARREFAF